MASAPALVRRVLAHPSAVLLFVQLGGVLLYPFTEGASPWGRGVVEIFGALVLALAVLSVRRSPTPTWVAVALAVLASALSVLDALVPSLALDLASTALHAAFYVWAAANLMSYMLADATVTSDELFAVGATFTLVAWAFAYVFDLVQLLQPGAFTAAVDPEAQRTWTELLFLSFSNLSSTGLSDIYPVTPQARSVVMIEQLAGLAYVVLFVSLVVGLTLRRQSARAAAEEARAAAQVEAGARPGRESAGGAGG